MALAGDRMAVASSLGYAHMSLASSTSTASSLSMARGPHRRARKAGAVAAVGLGGGRAVGGSSGASLVCRSSVSPLSDANGNVTEFQSGTCALPPTLLSLEFVRIPLCRKWRRSLVVFACGANCVTVKVV